MNIPDTTRIHARPAVDSDEALLLEWANDPETRRNAFSRADITPAVHHDWFRRRLGDTESCRIFVIETAAKVPIGQVRFERCEEGWRIDYAIDPKLRGRRLGRPLLTAALEKLSESEPRAVVFGDVKAENLASRRVFESLGFHSRDTGEAVRYDLVLGIDHRSPLRPPL